MKAPFTAVTVVQWRRFPLSSTLRQALGRGGFEEVVDAERLERARALE